MPDWILAAVILFGFIFYGFRQGMKVKPDRGKSNFRTWRKRLVRHI